MNNEIILEMRQVSKYYPGVKALEDINFQLEKGEIHALVGENGAGKSTLIKVLSGAIQQDQGEIIIESEKAGLLNPCKSEKLGISVIYQEFNLIPYLTVSENIFLGNELKGRLITDEKKMNHETKTLLDTLGIDINPATRIRNLSVAYQQIVEIAKSLSKKARILIFDEPSAPLSNREVEKLLDMVKKLKESGVSIIYISHRIEEIFQISDRVSVMRDGRLIKTMPVKDTSRSELIKLMVGRDLSNYYPASQTITGEIILSVEGLENPKLKGISFSLKKGEILGIAGLVGAGRTELARAVFGSDNISKGQIVLKGAAVQIKGPSDAIKLGIGLIPEDRKRQGLILGQTVKENCTLANLKKISRFKMVRSKLEKEFVQTMIRTLLIKCTGVGQTVKNLSGGNQQKVVLAKWLFTDSEILIFDEPTRGIDVGAKQEIYELMRKLTNEGKSLIVISSEMQELIGMSDRIAVMHEGRINGILEKNEINQNAVLDLAAGGQIKKESRLC
jgi:ribose transport system ATP-binding protein